MNTRIPIRELVEFGITCFFACMLANLLSGCSLIPIVGPDPIPEPAEIEAGCEAACDRLDILRCPGWQGAPGLDGDYGTGDDVACKDVCVYTISKGYPFEWACIAGSNACREIMECGD